MAGTHKCQARASSLNCEPQQSSVHGKGQAFPSGIQTTGVQVHAKAQNTSMQHLVLKVPAKPGRGEEGMVSRVFRQLTFAFAFWKRIRECTCRIPCLGMQGKSSALYMRKGTVTEAFTLLCTLWWRRSTAPHAKWRSPRTQSQATQAKRVPSCLSTESDASRVAPSAGLIPPFVIHGCPVVAIQESKS